MKLFDAVISKNFKTLKDIEEAINLMMPEINESLDS
jgi:hypothetical protein